MRIAVIGTGYVGLVTGAVLAHQGHDVTCVDNDPAKIATLARGELPIYEPGLPELVAEGTASGRLAFAGEIDGPVRGSELVFICVGTPPLQSGKADLSFIEQVAREIAGALDGYTVIVEKSTVPVRTGMRVKQTIEREAAPGTAFDVASNPEFLREGSAVRDMLAPDRIVIGVDSARARGVLEALYTPFGAPLIVTDIESAELIKHASNSFLALKISYINSVAHVCERVGADVEQVARGMGLDPRIAPGALHAGIGYGGSCFPKDVAAFYDLSKEVGYEFELLRLAQQINADQRLHFLKKIEQALWVVKGKQVGLLGLSFKPETDDLREAPSIDVVRWLVESGATVRVHDPVATDKARGVLPPIEYAADPYEAARGADALVLVTEWAQYRELDLGRLAGLMRQPLLIDGRNVFDPAAMKSAGFEYVSIGR